MNISGNPVASLFRKRTGWEQNKIGSNTNTLPIGFYYNMCQEGQQSRAKNVIHKWGGRECEGGWEFCRGFFDYYGFKINICLSGYTIVPK